MTKMIMLASALIGAATGLFAAYYFPADAFLAAANAKQSGEDADQKCEDLFTHFFFNFVISSMFSGLMMSLMLSMPAINTAMFFGAWILISMMYFSWSIRHNIVASMRFACSIRKKYITLFLLEVPMTLVQIYVIIAMIIASITGL